MYKRKLMRDNVLKRMDFYNAYCHIIDEWLSTEDRYVIDVRNVKFDDREALMRALSPPDNAVYMSIYIIIFKAKENYEVTLSILYLDKDESIIREQEYLLGKNDKSYMIEQLSKNGKLDNMEYQIRHSFEHCLDNR